MLSFIRRIFAFLFRLLLKPLLFIALLFSCAVLKDLISPSQTVPRESLQYPFQPLSNLQGFGEDTIQFPHASEFLFSILKNQKPKEKGTVMFLHGFPDTHYSWDEQLRFFDDQGYFVLAPSLRGYNAKPAPSRPVDNETCDSVWATCLADDVIAILDYYQVHEGDPVYLVGHDWGSIVASTVAAKYPKSFTKLILVSVPALKYMPLPYSCFLSSPTQLFNSWYMLFFQLPVLPELAVTHLPLIDTLFYLWRGNVHACGADSQEEQIEPVLESDDALQKIIFSLQKLQKKIASAFTSTDCDSGTKITARYSPFRLAAVKHALLAPTTLQKRSVLSWAIEYYRTNVPLLLFGDLIIPLLSPSNQVYAKESLELAQRDIDVPTLYIMGDTDGCISRAVAECSFQGDQFQQQVEIEFIHLAGHFVQHDAPQVFNEKLLAWIQK